MEVRFETMLCMWDDKIPEMLLTLINVITLTRNEEELRNSIRKFAETNELDKFFAYGYAPFLVTPTLYEQPRHDFSQQTFVCTFLIFY
jgi:hypothetical protein